MLAFVKLEKKKLEKIDSKIKEVLRKICYERDDV